MQIKLDGRVALITGGSRGLGKAMALTFARAGADVAIAARRDDVLQETKAEIESAAQQRVMAISCDVRDAGNIEALYRQVTEGLGPVDILVNNAGTSATGKFEEITDEMWQSDFDLKVLSAIRLSRLAFPPMKSRGWGRIINVLNAHAKAPAPGSAPTSVSRAAGMALTKVLAGEGAPHNVLVNALCTGLIVSDQWRDRHSSAGDGKSFEEFVASVGERVPLGRMGEAQEFANIACFLASDAAGYITGTAINVDGGLAPVV